MIRSLPNRRKQTIKLGADPIPEIPPEEGIPGGESPLPKPVIDESGLQDLTNEYNDLQSEAAEAAQLDEKTQQVLQRVTEVFTERSLEPEQMEKAVNVINAVADFVKSNLPDEEPSAADKVDVANKAQKIEDNFVRESNQNNDPQTKDGLNVKKRSGLTTLRTEPELRDDVVNEAVNKNESDVKDDAESKITDKQNNGQIGKRVGDFLLSLLKLAAAVGSVFLIDWLVARDKTDCYFINGSSENKIGCPDYKENPNRCACPLALVGESEPSSEKDIVEASQTGGDASDIADWCADGNTNAELQNSPVCAKASPGSVPACKAPEEIPSLDTAVCPNNGKSYFVWKQYSWMDILGDQLNELNDAASDVFRGLNWSFENIGKIIIGVAVLIAAIILIKILQLLLQSRTKK